MIWTYGTKIKTKVGSLLKLILKQNHFLSHFIEFSLNFKANFKLKGEAFKTRELEEICNLIIFKVIKVNLKAFPLIN